MMMIMRVKGDDDNNNVDDDDDDDDDIIVDGWFMVLHCDVVTLYLTLLITHQ